MRYFTKDMWLGLTNIEEECYWDKKWKRNILKYNQYLKKISTKVPKSFFNLIKSGHLHGDYLLELEIKNVIKKVYFQKETKEIHPESIKKGKINININLLCPSKYRKYLEYQDVKRYELEFPSDKPLPLADNDTFGSWGYDEIELLKNGWIKHEIIFHSGATVVIIFRKFKFRKEKFTGTTIDEGDVG